jgi:enoyl-CoA hydratase
VTKTAPSTAAEAAPAANGKTASPFIRVEFPAAAPASAAPADVLAGVALVTLQRPDALNALSFALLDELATALESLDADPACRAIVITGSGDRAFAAGADIHELQPQTSATLTAGGGFAAWDRIAAIGLPLIAAVRGFALGGGCELAMACDMIVAAEDASFGQPEIRLGVMPGAGGTQRLTRAIGVARSMELILTGRTMSAQEAEAHGLVTRLVPAAATVDAAVELAARIASMPPLAVRAAKAAILDAEERSLSEGLARERAAFFRLFDTEDQAEGMAAFTQKRPPVWSGR